MVHIYFLLCLSVHAGFYITPNLQYSSGTFESNRIVLQDSTTFETTLNGKIKGIGYGAQIGANYKRLAVGIDYSIQNYNWDLQKSETNSFDNNWIDTTATETSLSFMLAYLKLAKGRKLSFIIYGTYSLSSEIEMDANVNPDDLPLNYEGNLYKIGVGFHILKYIRIDTQYFLGSYKIATRDSLRFSLPSSINGTTYKALNYSGFKIQASFPFYFFTRRR